MYLLNGERKHCIEFSDRGFQYGDGLFETIEIVHGSPVFLDQHLHRLDQGCQRLLIPTPHIKTLKQEAYQLADNNIHAVLKLMVTRGSGGRGYRQPESIQVNRLFSLHPYPHYADDLVKQGIHLRFCQTRLGLNPSLAGIKHMNRLEQVLARAEWNDPHISEGLMQDINGHVVEGTMSNVFLVKDGLLYTAEILQCGVKGIMRDIIIQLARQNKLTVIEKKITQQDVYTADELFVTNSIIGIWPVKQLEQQYYKVGVLTVKLQNLLSLFKKQKIHDC